MKLIPAPCAPPSLNTCINSLDKGWSFTSCFLKPNSWIALMLFPKVTISSSASAGRSCIRITWDNFSTSCSGTGHTFWNYIYFIRLRSAFLFRDCHQQYPNQENPSYKNRRWRKPACRRWKKCFFLAEFVPAIKDESAIFQKLQPLFHLFPPFLLLLQPRKILSLRSV